MLQLKASPGPSSSSDPRENADVSVIPRTLLSLMRKRKAFHKSIRWSQARERVTSLCSGRMKMPKS
jgi:hypothetical protein